MFVNNTEFVVVDRHTLPPNASETTLTEKSAQETVEIYQQNRVRDEIGRTGLSAALRPHCRMMPMLPRIIRDAKLDGLEKSGELNGERGTKGSRVRARQGRK